jgi:hypothetical protein
MAWINLKTWIRKRINDIKKSCSFRFPEGVAFIKNKNMKLFKLIIIFMVFTMGVNAQSKSYSALKDEFSSERDVHTFSVGGFFARAIIGFAGEHEFNKAIKEVKQIRLITIPGYQFKEKGLTLKGFKKFMQKDHFEELVNLQDNGDRVSIYMQENEKEHNHYMILIENDHEVVAIEIKGYIDPDRLYQESDLALRKI